MAVTPVDPPPATAAVEPAPRPSLTVDDAPVSAPPTFTPAPATVPITTPAPALETTTATGKPEADVQPEPETVKEQPAAPASVELDGASSAATPAHPPTTNTKSEPATEPLPAAVGDGADDGDDVTALDFQGAVDSNHDIPSVETLRKIENYIVLDRDGKSHTFKSLYSGKHAARRMLIIFVRHFFCGQCQEYLRALSASITPDTLLRLPISTFIAVIGCGDPSLIGMYAHETGCPFPIYADPTRKLYDELGMVRTLALGARPAYVTKNLVKSSIASVFQGLKQLKKGLATKGGDARQIGGEFLFEPLTVLSPVSTPWTEVDRQISDVVPSAPSGSAAAAGGGEGSRSGDSETGGSLTETSLDGKDDGEAAAGEEKRVTWCHRMKTTRDHCEIPELMEVLGLDGQGKPIRDRKRWERALEQRKGTGLSMASQISAMKAEAGTGTA
ncbi:AhpC/TSA antioxidant enzyme-domain-containing protein [Podospora appendiculata]|uniref:AhpC/TSA antioxidant enzyme-domain-containing protein n=1 Tax=Podospora appendiculata TaxID=314037 RepID=A0AAE0X6I7_9PEZI|nr:AhpC/TSA antioxidant enzyme-domain-containing protein [Podospora appendiculata]